MLVGKHGGRTVDLATSRGHILIHTQKGRKQQGEAVNPPSPPQWGTSSSTAPPPQLTDRLLTSSINTNITRRASPSTQLEGEEAPAALSWCGASFHPAWLSPGVKASGQI